MELSDDDLEGLPEFLIAASKNAGAEKGPCQSDCHPIALDYDAVFAVLAPARSAGPRLCGMGGARGQ